MTCSAYRERLRAQATTEQAGADRALEEHHAGCPACARFAAWLLALDAALRDLPRAPVPPAVLEAIREIPRRPGPLPWLPDLLRAGAFIVPGACVWYGRALLPEAAEFLAPAVIAFAGTFLLITAALRPRLLGPPA